MTHFVPLAKVPSTKETAELLLLHVLHRPPRDVVQDQGPQFISRFWKAFCYLIGAKVSMSSRDTPQTNGRTKRLNQDLEVCLRCLAYWSPTT